MHLSRKPLPAGIRPGAPGAGCHRTHLPPSLPPPPCPRAAAEVLLEEREKELGIEPDPAVAAYMKALGEHHRLATGAVWAAWRLGGVLWAARQGGTPWPLQAGVTLSTLVRAAALDLASAAPLV